MPGTKGHSGGTRKGAGRPPQTLRLRNGASLLIYEKSDGQPIAPTGPRKFTIEIEKRGYLRLTNGTIEYSIIL